MALSRVQIAADKSNFVKELRASENGDGIFQTYGDILTFAAVLGFKEGKRVPIEKVSRKDPDPVLQDQFRDPCIIGLIAVVETKDPQILTSEDEERDRQKTKIFQEYANGGLEILQMKLQGCVDYVNQMLLILETQRTGNTLDEDEFDLTAFL